MDCECKESDSIGMGVVGSCSMLYVAPVTMYTRLHIKLFVFNYVCVLFVGVKIKGVRYPLFMRSWLLWVFFSLQGCKMHWCRSLSSLNALAAP